MGDYMIPFFSALGSNVTFQGVAYRALWEDALAGGNEAGNIMMAQLVEMAAKKCAHGSKIVMSGFSQGAFIVHGAAKLLSAVATAKVSSVIIFGDTLPGQPVGNIPSDKVDALCNEGDNVCRPELGDWRKFISPTHLQYGPRGAEAAAFVDAHEAAALVSEL